MILIFATISLTAATKHSVSCILQIVLQRYFREAGCMELCQCDGAFSPQIKDGHTRQLCVDFNCIV